MKHAYQIVYKLENIKLESTEIRLIENIIKFYI